MRSYLSPFIAAGLLGAFVWLALKRPVFSQAEKNSLAKRARRRREAMLGGRPYDGKAPERSTVAPDFDRLSPGRILEKYADDEPSLSEGRDVRRSLEQSGAAESEASPSGSGSYLMIAVRKVKSLDYQCIAGVMGFMRCRLLMPRVQESVPCKCAFCSLHAINLHPLNIDLLKICALGLQVTIWLSESQPGCAYPRCTTCSCQATSQPASACSRSFRMSSPG